MERMGPGKTIMIDPRWETEAEIAEERKRLRLELQLAKLSLEVRLNLSSVESLTWIVKFLLPHMESEERQEFLKEIGQYEK